MASSVSLDMVEVASPKNATLGAFGPPEQREGARRVQSPEAMAIEGNLAGPTKHKRARSKRAFFGWTFTTLSDWRSQSKNATIGAFKPP